MFVCISCDRMDRDFMDTALALLECDCCNHKDWCILVNKEEKPCQG